MEGLGLGYINLDEVLEFVKDQDGVERVYYKDEKGETHCIGTREYYEARKALIECYLIEHDKIMKVFSEQWEALSKKYGESVEINSKT